jgi:hypothetical protein
MAEQRPTVGHLTRYVTAARAVTLYSSYINKSLVANSQGSGSTLLRHLTHESECYKLE